MTQEDKLDLLIEKVAELEEIDKKLSQQLDYVVRRLDHMRDKAHERREREATWPT